MCHLVIMTLKELFADLYRSPSKQCTENTHFFFAGALGRELKNSQHNSHVGPCLFKLSKNKHVNVGDPVSPVLITKRKLISLM